MLSQHQIREKVVALQSGAISLEVFEEWFDDAAWGMHVNGSDPDVVDLAESIDSIFSAIRYAGLSSAEARREIISITARSAVRISWKTSEFLSQQEPDARSSSQVLRASAYRVPVPA